ncbi:MAG: hypothetical protein IID45_12815, partial [Planctomycetes bacterium]|nr:hypothetical protein [Planctomycetota bacterium]
MATAKEQLVRMNDVLDTPHLLVGGLATNCYVPYRESVDIDIVCNHTTAKTLLKKLYPTSDCDVVDLNKDEYRPSYVITNKLKDFEVYFGPKITEREPYSFVDWDYILGDATPLTYEGQALPNILVPTLELLAFSKLGSFCSRKKYNINKSTTDLADFVDLSNNEDFRSNRLLTAIERNSVSDVLKIALKELDDTHLACLDDSRFGRLSTLLRGESPRLVEFCRGRNNFVKVTREMFKRADESGDATEVAGISTGRTIDPESLGYLARMCAAGCRVRLLTSARAGQEQINQYKQIG